MTHIPESDGKRILKGFQWTYISVALQGLLKLVALMVLARILTPRDFGLLGFALICTNFVERIGQGGFGPAVVQVKEATKSIVTTAARTSVAFGILSMLALALSSGALASFFGERELALVVITLSVGCLIESLIAIPEALLQRNLRCKEIMMADNIAYLISMIVICPSMAFLGWGVWSLVVAQLALKIIRLVIIQRAAPPCLSGVWSTVEALKLTKLAFGFSLGRLLNFFSLQGDNFVVGRLLGTEALGMYNRAYQLMTLPAIYFGQVFERVMFPAMARKQSNKKELGDEFLIALEVITAIALPAGVVMFALANEIVLVGFGSRWLSVVPVVSVLSFGVFFRTAYKCSDTVVRSLGAVYDYAGRQALYATLVIGGAYFGAKYDQIGGVAVGVVLAVAINYLSMTRLSSRLLGLRLPQIISAHLLGIWSSLWVGAALALVLAQLRGQNLSPLISLLASSCAAVVAWLLSMTLAMLFVPYGTLGRIRQMMQSRPSLTRS
jgi:O-antigen/teichoic acid export membrane protein